MMSTAQSYTGNGISYLEDIHSARVVLHTAESRTPPTPDLEKRLSPDWREGADLAQQYGEDGIPKFLTNVGKRDPTRLGIYKQALDSAKVDPAQDAPDSADVSRATTKAEASAGQATDLDKRLADLNRTDLGNAQRLVERHGRTVRYCHPWTKWLHYDGTRWAIDQSASVRTLARDTVRQICFEAGTIADKEQRFEHAKFGLSSESRSRINSLLELAQAERGIPILHTEMDQHPWLFNFQNGTVDLRTGELRSHRRGDYLTKVCPFSFDLDAKCPLWDQTLATFLVDPELIRFFKHIFGYAMTGIIRDHVLPIAYGTGSNGKSTLLNLLMAAFGPDYAMKAAPDLLMAKRNDSHPTDRADLFGKRLVVAIETEEGRRLNETLVKELTGGDPIRGRRMREDFWEFNPTHTIVLATNHKPKISGTDHGIWRRLKLIPFLVSMTDAKADKAMPEKLLAELPGILAWCVRGCIEWQEQGSLIAPKQVADATAVYRSEQDTLAAFIDERTVVMVGIKTQASAIYADYKAWAEETGEYAMTNTKFGTALQERGFESFKSGSMWYRGIGLRSNREASRMD